jgi:hypothetical protein
MREFASANRDEYFKLTGHDYPDCQFWQIHTPLSENITPKSAEA